MRQQNTWDSLCSHVRCTVPGRAEQHLWPRSGPTGCPVHTGDASQPACVAPQHALLPEAGCHGCVLEQGGGLCRRRARAEEAEAITLSTTVHHSPPHQACRPSPPQKVTMKYKIMQKMEGMSESMGTSEMVRAT